MSIVNNNGVFGECLIMFTSRLTASSVIESYRCKMKVRCDQSHGCKLNLIKLSVIAINVCIVNNSEVFGECLMTLTSR